MARTSRKKNYAVQTSSDSEHGRLYKTAGYLRLSVEDGGTPGSDTLDGQKAMVERFIENQPDMKLVSLFCDNGESGTDFVRPEFGNMMDAVRRGKIDCIVVKDLSRFGRDYKESGNYIEHIFPTLGVRFVAINDNFDTLTAERNEYGFIVPLKNLINEVYSKDISRKSSSALNAKQRNGEYIGNWAPYGYSKDPSDKHRLIINEETAPAVRRIFEWRCDGVSLPQIARRLNEAGVLSPAAYVYETGEVKTEKYCGVLWGTDVLRNLLSNPVYAGHMAQGKKRQSFYEGRKSSHVPEDEWIVVKNTHEPVVDDETFEKVQNISRRIRDEYHQRSGKFSHMEDSENILTGLVWCQNCKKPMIRRRNIGKDKKIRYYACRVHVIDPARCGFVSIHEDELIEIIFSAVRTQIAATVDIDAVVRKITDSPEFRKRCSDIQITLSAARQSLKRNQFRHDNLYQSYAEHMITEQEYMTLKCLYKDESAKAEMRIAELEREQSNMMSLISENRILTEFRSFVDSDTLTKEMAAALIERVYVGADKNVDIHFKYRDEYETVADRIDVRNAI